MNCRMAAEANTTQEAPNPSDVLRIMLASDLHLGFAERDPERAMDSFRTFEEVLQRAVEHDVDFILLGLLHHPLFALCHQAILFHRLRASMFSFNYLSLDFTKLEICLPFHLQTSFHPLWAFNVRNRLAIKMKN